MESKTTVEIIMPNVEVIASHAFVITLLIKDQNDNSIKNGFIDIYFGDEYVESISIIQGIAYLKRNFLYSGIYNITAIYAGDTQYKECKINSVIKVKKMDTSLEINPVVIRVNNDMVLQAKVVDNYDNLINGGYVTFNIDGDVLTDSFNKPLQAYVVEGIATLLYTACEFLDKEFTLEASYTGTDKIYNISKGLQNNVSIINRNVFIQMITKKVVASIGDTIKLKVAVMDKFTNEKINKGFVVFKLKGKSICDEKYKPIQVKVIDGYATLPYTIPKNMSAGQYDISALYNDNIANRTGDYSILSLEKLEIQLSVDPIIKLDNVADVKGKILDKKGSLVSGLSKLSIKCNETEVITTEIYGGVIDVTFPTINFNKEYYKVTLTVEENKEYKGTIITTNLVDLD